MIKNYLPFHTLFIDFQFQLSRSTIKLARKHAKLPIAIFIRPRSSWWQVIGHEQTTWRATVERADRWSSRSVTQFPKKSCEQLRKVEDPRRRGGKKGAKDVGAARRPRSTEFRDKSLPVAVEQNLPEQLDPRRANFLARRAPRILGQSPRWPRISGLLGGGGNSSRRDFETATIPPSNTFPRRRTRRLTKRKVVWTIGSKWIKRIF